MRLHSFLHVVKKFGNHFLSGDITRCIFILKFSKGPIIAFLLHQLEKLSELVDSSLVLRDADGEEMSILVIITLGRCGMVVVSQIQLLSHFIPPKITA